MKTIRYLVYFNFLILIILTLTGCQLKKETSNKIKVMTTIFPLYDFTKQIGQDKVDVQLILPPGVEPHGYEPKPRGIFDIRRSDLFIYTGDFLEVWATKIITALKQDQITVVNASDGITLHYGHDENSIDPHIWLDPNNAMQMVDNITKGLITIDPGNKDFYETNATAYKEKLTNLDLAYQDLFSHSTYHTIIFGGHFVFGYLAERYQIDYTSPYTGFSPDALPTPRKIQELIQLIDRTGQKTIFYEELINPKVAQVISQQTKAQMLPLNGAGNISKEDYKNHVTYLLLMMDNIETLKKGLDYHE